MGRTQDSIGIRPDQNAVPTPDGGANETNYNRDLMGRRKTSKSATYPWTADTPVNAKSVRAAAKAKSLKPID